jgi:hypothetical protein
LFSPRDSFFDFATNSCSLSYPEIARQLLSQLDIKSESSFSDDEKSSFDKASNVCRLRLKRLMDKAKESTSRIFEELPTFRDEVFFDLADFPELVSTDSQGFIFDSQRSSSQRSDLEIEVPSHPDPDPNQIPFPIPFLVCHPHRDLLSRSSARLLKILDLWPNV